jgi:hypothetical protein
MVDSHAAELRRLEKQVTDLSDALAHLGDPDGFKRLIIIIRRPGWTSLPEQLFTSAIVESMLAHTKALEELKGKLLKASEAVGVKN